MSGQPCSSPWHPRGELGDVVRETPVAVYRLRVCPECGRPQGIARVTR